MILYILMLGDAVLGSYSSQEIAEANKDRFHKKRTGLSPSRYHIFPLHLDQPATFHNMSSVNRETRNAEGYTHE